MDRNMFPKLRETQLCLDTIENRLYDMLLRLRGFDRFLQIAIEVSEKMESDPDCSRIKSWIEGRLAVLKEIKREFDMILKDFEPEPLPTEK